MILSFILTCLLNTCLFAADNDTLTVALTGDVMMGTTYPSVQLPPDEGRQLFVDVAPLLRRADVAAGNLEGTLCDGGTSTKRISQSSYAFRTPTSFAPRLREAGYDFLSMANNHAFDFGDTGVSSTMRCLDSLGIAYCGLKSQPDHAIVERAGVRYGFCAFGHNGYTNLHLDTAAVRTTVSRLAALCDIVIVSFHGGAEGASHRRLPYGTETFYNENRGALRNLAHLCVDAGADIVYGHGPHVTRAVELYRDRLIAYSLGNFCTPYGMSLSGISGYAPVLEVKIDSFGRFLSGQIHSFVQRRGLGPRTDASCAVAREMKQLTELDIPSGLVSISSSGAISRR